MSDDREKPDAVHELCVRPSNTQWTRSCDSQGICPGPERSILWPAQQGRRT